MIPFNHLSPCENESSYLQQVLSSQQWGSHGPFAARCIDLIHEHLGSSTIAQLTHSCTSALELAALLLDLRPGDEVIMPSWSFSSTANAFAMRGATPVFIDIHPDTLNIDETLIEAAITPKTRAICVVHYAGVCCEMFSIFAIAQRHNLSIIEDAAQAYLSTYLDLFAGTMGDFGAISFHATKNNAAGEAGVLLTKHLDKLPAIETACAKGTNYAAFTRKEVPSYEWCSLGSAYPPSEFTAAILLAQLEHAQQRLHKRLAIWNKYHAAFRSLNGVRTPRVPASCNHNGHCYWLKLSSETARDAFIKSMRESGVQTSAHYLPLHTSPAGLRYGRLGADATSLPHTEDAARCIVRLPMTITPAEAYIVIDAVQDALH